MKNTFQAAKRVLSLIMVFAMLISFLPPVTVSAVTLTGGEQLYLKPNSNWESNNARFAVYFFNSSSNTWASMTDSNGDGIYEVTVPTGSWNNVIFCRMNPNNQTNSWNTKWNQTSDLTYNGTNNLYTVKEGTWDKGGGSWSTYTYVEPSYTYTVAGEAGLCGTAWDTANTANDMTKNDAGVYEKVYADVAAGTYKFKVVRNHSWDVSWGGTADSDGNAAVTVSEAGSTVTITFDPVSKTVKATVAKPLAVYNVTFNGTNVTSNGAATVTEGDDYSAVLSVESGYSLPNFIEVTGADEFSYDHESGELFIEASKITGDITITATGEVILKELYLKPNGNWPQGNAWFAAYFFGNGDTWVKMTDENWDGIYEVTAPAGYPSVIFCRMDPAKSDLGWGSKWDQTAELTIPTDEKDQFTIKDGDWSNASGTWSVYTFVEPVYTIAGTISPAGWDPANGDVLEGPDSDGVYSYIYANVAAGSYKFKVTNGTWDAAWPSSDYELTVEKDGSEVTVFFNAATKTVSVEVVPPVEHTVTFNGTNVTSDGASSVTAGNGYTATLTADEGYTLPETITVTGVSAFDYDPESGELTIAASAINGNITITAVGVEQVQDKQLYLKPNGNWTQANARFAAYFFGNGETWVSMTDENGDGVYEVTAPAGYPSVIFCRMNPSTTANNWNNKWNQTANLTVPTDETNLYTVKNGTWDNGGGTWSTYVYVAPTYTIAGTISPAGWDPANGDVLEGPDSDGVYSYIYANVAAGSYKFKVTNGTWDAAWPSSDYELTVEKDGSEVTVFFNVATKAVSVEVTAPAEYTVTFNGTNVTSDGAETVTEGNAYTATLTAAEGFELPDTVTVQIDGLDVAYSYDKATGLLTIEAAVITGDITITAVGVEPLPETKVIYLNAGGSSLWDQANAWFAAKVGNTVYKMVDLDFDGVYEVEIPYEATKIIFLRKDPAKTELDESSWNKTAVLTISGNCYKITGWGASNGTWSDFTPSAPEPQFTVAGAAGLCGSEWDTANTANDMTKNASGVYEKVYTNVAAGTYEFKVVLNHSWNKSWGDLNTASGNAEVTVAEAGSTVTVTFDPITLKVTAAVTTGGEEGGEDTSTEYEVTFHFVNTLGWSNVNLYTWIGSDTTLTGSWPGTAVNPDASGFYTATVTYEGETNNGLNFIFNNGSAQTVDLIVPASDFVENKAEKWVVLTTQTNGKYNAAITDSPEGIVTSPVVDGSSVTFNYGDNAATSVSVAGTFNNWTPAAMTKDADGVWTVTVNDLAAGDYQYKFIVNGTDWVLDPMNGNVVTEANGNQNSAFYILSDQGAEDDNTVTVRVHYLRADGNYENWNLWVWGSNMGGHQVDFAEELVDGAKVATIVLENARDHQDISFKQRKSVEGNGWADQGSKDLSIDLSTVVSGTIDYYIATETCVYGDDVIRKNKVSSVELDYDNNAVVVTFVQAISQPENVLKLFKGEEEIPVTITAVGSKYTLALSADHQVNLAQLYQYKVNYYGEYTIAIDAAYASDQFAAEFTYTGNDLGASYTSGSTTFRVWAPTAEAVSVNLYTAGNGGDLSNTVPMAKDVNGTWVVTVEGNLDGTYYTYLVNVNGAAVEACDPYARATGVNGKRAMVINLDSTDPGNWDSHSGSNPNPVSTQTNAVIYELHVRDFSIDADSGVSATNRGKYLAFTEKGTKTPGGNKTGIDYLKSLGFTHLHLLPVYDFGSVDETTSNTFNWGYDPVNYNVPEGSYSTNPYNGAVRVNEFKQMVQALHDADISVVMDVVYNHVYDAEEFCFNQIVPGYFSRVSSNTSGCGNDTASEREMIRKYIVDSVLYWHKEYNIDGFRFDLVGLLDVETVNQIVEEVHDCCSGVIFYGEGWNMDSTNKEPGTEMAKQGNAYKTPGFAYFSDSMRNGIAGNNGSSKGFVSGLANGAAMATEWMANPWWTKNPEQVVQYVSCHDNYTLADKLIISTGKSQIDDTVIKMNNLSAAFYMTAQGIPFIHAGEELLREKINSDGSRNHNSYNSSDAVNHIEWSNLDKENYAANAEYYKGLIEFRAAHKALRYGNATKVADNVQTYSASGNLIVMRVDGNGAGDDDIFVIFNAHTTAQTVQLPAGEWTININDKKAGTESLGTATGSVSVPAISAMVLTKTDEGKDEAAPVGPSEEKTIYFSNNKHWDKVYAYAWTENGEKLLLGAWPGTEMAYVETNDYGEKIFSITLPASATGIEGLIIGNGTDAQTVDIVPGVDGIGYYCTDTNSEGKFEVGTYTYRAPMLGGADDYFLVGWINNADYLGGDYKFQDGKLVTTFANDSYVYVINGDNTETYMTDGYQGAVLSATLKDTAKHQLTAEKWDKLPIPGGVEVTITMVKNSDHTVTLSYEMDIEAVKDTSGIQDGVTLHCWNWSFKEIEENMALIADMGFTAIQTSPVQPLKEATTDATDTVGGVWWVYYQPVDFKITDGAGNALGTKAELESMIETAHQYGVKVIVDVVVNHLGNKTGNDLADAIPEYLRKDAYWHDISKNISSWDDREDMTQNCLDGLPDLNTANKELQGFILDFLKECVDIGVDGFRFDMAKSIETPLDNASFASDFWPTVVCGAEDYAKASCGKDLYIYGEILDDAKIAIGAYAQYMAVTDNGWGNHLRSMIAADNATLVSGYYKSAPADALVIWAESHDTFASNASSGVSEADINKTWALVAARADAMGLYLARPESLTQLLGVASLTGWDNPEVEAANEFHNAFVGKPESIGNENGISYVVRGTTGAVLVNVSGNATVSVDALGMADGTYTDQITGNTFKVINGKLSGTIGATGIAVVYNVPKFAVTVSDTTGGTATADREAAEAGDTVTVTVTPAEGKEIDSLTVTDAAGAAVAVTELGNGTYSFVQPESAVTVSVTFKNKQVAPPAEHQVAVESNTSGSVEVSNRTPVAGAVVTITPKPDEGVAVDKVTVTDKNGNAITVTANEDGTYSFTQPEGDVTVKVTFKANYKFLLGNGGSAEHGSEETLQFKANGAFEKFVGIEVDGKTVDAAQYDAKTGSTVITLKAAFLKTLAAGEHSIKVIFTDGAVVGSFSLKQDDTTTGGEDETTTAPTTGDEDETTTAPSTTEKDDADVPPTGDEMPVQLWTTALTVSLLGLAVILLEQKKKYR